VSLDLPLFPLSSLLSLLSPLFPLSSLLSLENSEEQEQENEQQNSRTVNELALQPQSQHGEHAHGDGDETDKRRRHRRADGQQDFRPRDQARQALVHQVARGLELLGDGPAPVHRGRGLRRAPDGVRGPARAGARGRGGPLGGAPAARGAAGELPLEGGGGFVCVVVWVGVGGAARGKGAEGEGRRGGLGGARGGVGRGERGRRGQRGRRAKRARGRSDATPLCGPGVLLSSRLPAASPPSEESSFEGPASSPPSPVARTERTGRCCREPFRRGGREGRREEGRASDVGGNDNEDRVLSFFAWQLRVARQDGAAADAAATVARGASARAGIVS